MNTMALFSNFGTLDSNRGSATLYSIKGKCRLDSIDDLKYIGVLSGVRDCVVTDTQIDKSVMAMDVSSDKCMRLYDISRNLHESVTKPSDCIENAIKHTSEKFKYNYTHSILSEPSMLCGSLNTKMIAIARLCNLPVSTVGVKLQIQGEEGETDAVLHNPSGAAGFNHFNSWHVHFEAHSDMDVLMMMAAFLKHNGIWGEITANIDLFKFDYAGAFFDHRWMEAADETSFMAVRAQLISSYFKCKSAIKRVLKKRENLSCSELLECSNQNLSDEAMRGSSTVVGGGKWCPHLNGDFHVRLDERGKYSCLACFSTLFFVPRDIMSNFIVCKNKFEAQQWINDRLEKGGKIANDSNLKELMLKLADITQAAHGPITLGSCGRKWNWPSKMPSKLHEFIMYSLISALKKMRAFQLPQMNVDVLYCLMNPFGKMLLLFMHNVMVLNGASGRITPSHPGGVALGKWWDVYFVGPNLWSFQITKCEVERNNTVRNLACLETLHRLPLPDDGGRVDDRIVFKGFCRGENQASPGELVSDITQSVKTIALVLESRDFFIDENTHTIKSKASVGDVMCSLEVTGYRPNRAQESRNSGRVSSRIMRILDSREGARIWHSNKHCAILLEGVNHDTTQSIEAMERAIANHKILYYDIETNTLNFTEQSAVITSICCCLCTGGDISKGGERSIFGLAAPGTSVMELATKVKMAYPSSKKNLGGEYIVTDHAPDIVNIYSNEFEMLMGFAEYVHERKPHIVSGWNSAAFDDPFVFTRIVKHLSCPAICPMATIETAKSVLPNRITLKEERLALAKTGLFNLEQFMDIKTGYMHRSVTIDMMTGATSQVSTKFHEQTKIESGRTGSAGWYQNIIGGCCMAIRLDLMKVCAKAYKESLSEFNLNAVLAKVSNVGDRLKNVKDVVDLNYHLLGFLKLTSVEDQATVHVYCCKDAYLTAVVSTSINKEGEIFRLCLDSALTENVVVANLATPLCIGEGAICRNMGLERSNKRGVGIRRHSIATDTKGGMVSQPIVNHVPYQTIDMTSLYPMTMCQNNLCTSTFVTHRQVIDLRDRLVEIEIKKNPARRLLSIIDECNIKVLESYRPNDIAVASWKTSNNNKTTSVTRLEKRIGKNFSGNKCEREDGEDDWCANAPPNMALTSAGLDYFPEVICDANIQQAAKVNDDMHISPSSFEYLLQVLPMMVITRPHIAAQITAGECQTVEECLTALEEEFNEEKDAQIIKTHWTFAGVPQFDFSSSPVTKTVKNIAERTGRNVEYTLRKCERISGLLDRIYRRVSVFNSADDYGVRLWTSRLINVGMLVRTWNIKNTILEGIIPAMQTKYRADRVIMQQNAKKFGAAGDLKRAGLNKVGQLIMKLCMNSMYGCLALRAKSSKREFTTEAASSASSIANAATAGGVGGGTRHAATANQITEISRCVFGNIGCALQQALPGLKQTYGDTDSVFCVHNIPGDGDGVPSEREGDGRMVYLIDMGLKRKLSQIIPLLVNCTTKGIRPVPRRDAGCGVMNIAHERLTVLGLLFAKKTYHMLHFNENSTGFKEMIAACEKNGNIGKNIDKFVKVTSRPEYAAEYVVPHNPSLIFLAANTEGGENLRDFLNSEGIVDKESMREWFTSSPVWIEVDARVLQNLYASKIVDAEKGNWIDAESSRPLTDEREIDAVIQANATFTPYKKGSFAKKGISASTKLKGLQSLFSRALPEGMGPNETYITGVKNHVKNFASHTTNPSLMITSARVNKLDPNVAQNRPNPLALAINNHLNPSSCISLGEKFKTVMSVSAWSLTVESKEIPAGYFHTGGVRWNPEKMKGVISCFSVKNLSVVPNAVSIAYEMMDSEKKALASMVKKIADVLCTACAISGFSLRPGALSFSTGVVVTNDLAMACIRAASNKDIKNLFMGGKQPIDYEEEEEEEEEKYDYTANFFSNDIREGVFSRLVNASCSACDTIAERKKVIENAKKKTLNAYIIETMGLDRRVAKQLDALINQVETVKELCNKKRQIDGSFKSQFDNMVAEVKVEFAPLLDEAAKLTKLHWLKCPIAMPAEEKESEGSGVSLKVALEAMAGKYKCTDTCDLACCQSLYFVLLYTLALNFENERRRNEIPFDDAASLMANAIFDGDIYKADLAMKKIRKARREKTVKVTLSKNYNFDTDCLIYLFEPSRIINNNIASMSIEDLKAAVSSLSDSKVTGKMWNRLDRRFFGCLLDRETTVKEEARCCAEQELPFVTGVYHTAAIEIAAACLSLNL